MHTFVVTVFVASQFCTTLQAQPKATMTLAELLAQVDTHPQLEMIRAEIEAGKSQIPMRSSLMNPMLILGVQNVPTNFSFNQDPMTAKVIGVEQDFSFPGKLSKERALGELSVQTTEASLAEERNMLRRDVKLSWFEILHRRRSLAAYQYHLQALETVEKEITIGISYGKNTVSEQKQLELERTEIGQMMAEEQAMISMQYAKLSYATGIENMDIPAVDSLPLSGFYYSLDSLMQIALNHRPLLKGLQSSVQQAELSIERSTLERYPDFGVMLMYMQRDALAPGSMGGDPAMSTPQMNMISAQLSIKLPLNYNGKNDAGIAEAQSMRQMKLAEERMATREIRFMLSEQLAKLQELRTKHNLIASSTLPALRTIRQFQTNAYGFDKVSLSTLVSNELSALHKQHDLFEIESEYYKTIAQIEFLIGIDLIAP
ncbi:MAG TPA: TolC family protein [Candidatus Kapabacteria bacterium]|nr:TolC family protein [Candidatus Kapabacteria bacterium]